MINEKQALDNMAREQLEQQLEKWEKEELAHFLKRQPEQKEDFSTFGDIPVKRVYTALDVQDTPIEDIGLPGQYPFTRGPYPTMYRGRTWTMRQIAGFGTGEDTNRRFKYLIAQGQTGISTDFDMPTLMGYDSDHPMSTGEVGREGVAVDTLADMDALYADIDLENISVSMTINPSAWILLAMYYALGEKRGFDPHRLAGTIQADILKEYMAQKEWIYPIRPSVRIVRDCITFCAEHMKRFNPINISGYHISEAGGSPLQELAFTMANTITYVDEVTKAGIDVDDFAPRLSFFFVCQRDFFEEIAKFRAARRIYAKIMKERFGARSPESMRLRFHCGTAAATLTKPQYRVNTVRTTLQALSAVSGWCPKPARERHGRSLRHSDGRGDEAGASHPAGHRRGIEREPNHRPSGRVLLRREPDDLLREGNLPHPRRDRCPWRHGEADRGRLVPAPDRRFCLRDGDEEGERRIPADRCQPIRGRRRKAGRGTPRPTTRPSRNARAGD